MGERRPPIRLHPMMLDATTQAIEGIARDAGQFNRRMPIDERILRMAEAEYERQYPPGQTIDRLRERGGLAFYEMVGFLAEALARYAPPDALVPKSLTIPAAGEVRNDG